MTITLDIPEEVINSLGATPTERSQRACEAIALQLYREGKVSLRMMGQLAGVGGDYWSANAFREKHGAPLNPEATAQDDQDAIKQLRNQA